MLEGKLISDQDPRTILEGELVGDERPGGLVRRGRSTAMPRTATVHAVTTIGIDMGKNTLHPAFPG